MLSRRSKNSLPVFLKYDTILLKTYFDIANTGDFAKLVVNGEATSEQCKEKWNEIVAVNFENFGTFDFIGYVDNVEGYNSFLREHNLTIAELLVLYFQVDDDIIMELRERGYNIDTSSKSNYITSLERAMERSKSLQSRIRMKSNELENLTSHLKDTQPATFDEIMASLIINLGFTIPDEITLARFNQYRNLIVQKHKRQSQIEA